MLWPLVLGVVDILASRRLGLCGWRNAAWVTFVFLLIWVFAAGLDVVWTYWYVAAYTDTPALVALVLLNIFGVLLGVYICFRSRRRPTTMSVASFGSGELGIGERASDQKSPVDEIIGATEIGRASV